MLEKHYLENLYPLQDKVLRLFSGIGLRHYLTGGTAFSRIYAHHRFSDDLDFFLNQDSEFNVETNRAVSCLMKEFPGSILKTKQDGLVIVLLHSDLAELKVEFVNDVGYHYGTNLNHPLYHNVDHHLNILSNKLCALSRNAAKDVADLWMLSKLYSFNWGWAIGQAQAKDTWVNEADVVNAFESFDFNRLATDVNWCIDLDFEKMKNDLLLISHEIALGADNTLCKP